MEFNISEAQYGTRPAVEKPDSRFLEALGEANFRALISDHYELLKKSTIAHLFPQEEKAFELAKKHSADFFIQICGGPAYFNQSRGAPMMFIRHEPFKITPSARKVWLECYIEVLEKLDLNEDLKRSFWDYLDIFSIWMLNTPED
ncbi:MAG: hypothetical protein WBO82_10055 [Neisseria sp.]|jgi:hemoglobin